MKTLSLQPPRWMCTNPILHVTKHALFSDWPWAYTHLHFLQGRTNKQTWHFLIITQHFLTMTQHDPSLPDHDSTLSLPQPSTSSLGLSIFFTMTQHFPDSDPAPSLPCLSTFLSMTQPFLTMIQLLVIMTQDFFTMTHFFLTMTQSFLSMTLCPPIYDSAPSWYESTLPDHDLALSYVSVKYTYPTTVLFRNFSSMLSISIYQKAFRTQTLNNSPAKIWSLCILA